MPCAERNEPVSFFETRVVHRSKTFPLLDLSVQHFDLLNYLAGVAYKPAGCPRNSRVCAHFKPLLEEQERNEGSREEKGNLRSLGGH